MDNTEERPHLFASGVEKLHSGQTRENSPQDKKNGSIDHVWQDTAVGFTMQITNRLGPEGDIIEALLSIADEAKEAGMWGTAEELETIATDLLAIASRAEGYLLR